MEWWIWLIIALVLLIVEIISLDLVLLMLSGGALAAALGAGLGVDNVIVQVLLWAVVSLLLLAFVRKWALEKLHLRKDDSETNVAGYAGRPGVAVTEVGQNGRIKFNGEVWSARSFDGTVIDEGADVVVIEIDGATAVVRTA